MPERTVYYAMLVGDRTIQQPSGLARRRYLDNDGIRDEALTRDFTWIHNPGLAGWERGDLTTNYVEVSKEEAERIIEGFRARWQAEA